MTLEEYLEQENKRKEQQNRTFKKIFYWGMAWVAVSFVLGMGFVWWQWQQSNEIVEEALKGSSPQWKENVQLSLQYCHQLANWSEAESARGMDADRQVELMAEANEVTFDQMILILNSCSDKMEERNRWEDSGRLPYEHCESIAKYVLRRGVAGETDPRKVWKELEDSYVVSGDTLYTWLDDCRERLPASLTGNHLAPQS